MNKKELKELIIRRGGKIINCHKFIYHQETYYFDYFIKDWKQRNYKISKHQIKQEYKSEVKRFTKKKDDIEGDEKLTTSETIFGIFEFWEAVVFIVPFSIIIFFPYLFYSLFCFIINSALVLFSYRKNEYESLEKRIEDLEKWAKTFPEFYYKKLKPKRKLNWAFKKFIINNYSIATSKSIVLTFENYAQMKKILFEKEFDGKNKK